MTINTSVIITGKVTTNPFREWITKEGDIYVGDDHIPNYIYNNYLGRNIRITIEVLPDEAEEDK